MKYVGNKEENIEYRKRPGAYASKMFREWQRYVMERFIEERKQGKMCFIK